MVPLDFDRELSPNRFFSAHGWGVERVIEPSQGLSLSWPVLLSQHSQSCALHALYCERQVKQTPRLISHDMRPLELLLLLARAEQLRPMTGFVFGRRSFFQDQLGVRENESRR